MKSIFVLISVIIIFIPTISYIACYFWEEYYQREKRQAHLDRHIRDSYRKKIWKIKSISNKIRLAIGLISLVISFLWILQILFFAHSVFTQTIPDEPLDIIGFENANNVNINEMFSRDNVFKKTEDIFLDSYKKELFSHLKGASLIAYRRVFAGIYAAPGDIPDMSYSRLTSTQKKEIKEYTSEIDQIQEKKRRENVSEEVAVREYYLYTAVNSIYDSAENIYQTARSAEDVFWKHCSSMPSDYTTLLEYASYSISSFQTFYMHQNHTVNDGSIERKVTSAELYYRNGKLFRAISERTDNIEEKEHYYRCSYCCFRNITADDTSDNYWSFMGYIYLCESIVSLLSNTDITKEDYLDLLDEADSSYQHAQEIFNNVKPSSGSTELLTKDGKTFHSENNVSQKLEEIRNGLSRFKDTRLAQGAVTK